MNADDSTDDSESCDSSWTDHASSLHLMGYSIPVTPERKVGQEWAEYNFLKRSTEIHSEIHISNVEG